MVARGAGWVQARLALWKHTGAPMVCVAHERKASASPWGEVGSL